MKYLYSMIIIILFNGCTAHKDFVSNMNSQIGLKVPLNVQPYKYKWAGKMFRADYVKASIGLTHITQDKKGNIIRHWHGQEVLPNYDDKNMVGKCLTYQVVDSKTGEILFWGFDKGGNPKSCVAWWP